LADGSRALAAIDGKTVRRSFGRQAGAAPLHLIRAWAGTQLKALKRRGAAGGVGRAAATSANLYADAAEWIVARRLGATPDPLALGMPTVEDGARGARLIEAAVESLPDGGRWTDCRLQL
jgi:hypothetical protein